jgi:hypothetical protein
LTKTDDVLLELRRAFDAYLKSFFPFEYENKTYRLVNSYVASPWTRCDVCGNHPIKYVSVIRSSYGKELRVGNKCIDRLTNRKVSAWFRKFRTKYDNISSNRRFIDGIASILTSYKGRKLSLQISESDLAKLQKAFMDMCNGFNLGGKQKQLVECYISRIADA